MVEVIKNITVIDDEKERKLIIDDIYHNYFVEASAGSGKTFSLVYRMVKMVEEGIPVDKICTITFTKAAAGEFFSRFQELLSQRAVLEKIPADDDTVPRLGPKTELTVKRCQEALNNIDLCFMGTIDAFCNTIAHELPTELKIPSDCEVVSKEEMNDYLISHYRHILTNVNNKLHKYALKFDDLYYKGEEAFVVGINAIKDYRGKIIKCDDSYLDVDIEVLLKDYKSILIDIFKGILEVNPKIGDERKSKAYHSFKATSKLIFSKNWNDCLAHVINAVDNLHKFLSKDEGFINSSLSVSYLEITETKSKTAKNKISSIKFNETTQEILDKVSIIIKRYKFNYYIAFLNLVVDDVVKQLKKQGKFSFFDFLIYTTEAFKKSSGTDRKLLNHILERHTYFLIDESQDTDPLQTQMFFYLTGTKITDVWYETEPSEEKYGHLFIVGDPKQSIYAFKGADVDSYRETEQVFDKKDEVLILRKNFRSNVRLREWFNDAMGGIFIDSDSGLIHEEIPIPQADYDILPDKSVLDDDVSVIDGEYRYQISDIDDDAEVVASIILDLVNNPKRKIIQKVKVNKKYEYQFTGVDFKDFLIVPFRTNVRNMLDVFDSYQIPYVIELNIPYKKSKTLEVIKKLLLVLKNPSRRDLLLKLLMSDLYGLNDFDLNQLILDKFNFDIRNIDNSSLTNAKIKQNIEELHRIFKETKNMTYSSTIFYLLNEPSLKLFNKVGVEFLEYTYFFYEKVKEAEDNNDLNTLDDLIRIIDKFSASKTDDNRILRFKNKINKVKISNLHKVKGLEAPIVILSTPKISNLDPDSYEDKTKNPIEVHLSKVETIDGGIPKRYVENVDFDPDLARLKDKKKDEENDRLQYVAATRARSVLIVSEIVDPGNKTQAWDKILKYIDASSCTYPFLDIIQRPDPVEKVELELDKPIEFDSELSITFVSPSSALSERKIPSYITNEDIMPEYTNDLNEINASTLGTLVHKLMECLINSRGEVKDKELLVNKIVKTFAVDEKCKLLLLKVLDTLLNGGYEQTNSTLDRDIIKLIKESKQVFSEVPFSYNNIKNEIVHGVIDFIYVDNDDKYHIIDFKTNKQKDVSLLEEHYSSQLLYYINGVKKSLNIRDNSDIDAKIYHIDIYNL